MGNEFKDFEMETPSLTLEPDLGEFEKKEEVLPKKQTQKEEVPAKEEKGHGIGLANVRKMVEKYQGFMDVSNTNQIFTVKVMLYL